MVHRRFQLLQLIAVAALAFSVLLGATPATAQSKLKLIETKISSRLPAARPDWPVPRDQFTVFYIQRSSNPNTVVYGARFDKNGTLKRNKAVVAYWRRFNTDGAVKPLNFVERNFAYGVNFRRNSDDETYKVTFKALKDLNTTLRPDGPNKAALWAKIGNVDIRLAYAFLDLDENGVVPKVTRLRLYGTDPKSGRAHTYIFSVSGGAIRE